MELFHPAKRLKLSDSPKIPSVSKVTVSSICNGADEEESGSTPSSLTPEQRARVEFNKLLAQSKRNLKICTERVSKARGRL